MTWSFNSQEVRVCWLDLDHHRLRLHSLKLVIQKEWKSQFGFNQGFAVNFTERASLGLF